MYKIILPDGQTYIVSDVQYMVVVEAFTVKDGTHYYCDKTFEPMLKLKNNNLYDILVTYLQDCHIRNQIRD